MVKIDSGECIWELAQKDAKFRHGIAQNGLILKQQKLEKTKKKQCFQNYSDLWTSCQIFGFLFFLIVLLFFVFLVFLFFFGFLEVFFR